MDDDDGIVTPLKTRAQILQKARTRPVRNNCDR
jgi:hypothetical protein